MEYWTSEIMRRYCRRKKKRDNNDMMKTTLMDLPRDIIIHILLRLPLKTLGCLRCVSKTLLNRLDDPHFGAAHTRLLTTTNAAAQVPQLVFGIVLGVVALQSMKYDGVALRAESKHAIISFISPPSEPLLVKYCLDFCYYDLFFFRESVFGGHPCFLFNPLRREVLKLPTNNFPVQKNVRCSYGMGFDNITSTHKIVCVSSNSEQGCLESQVNVLVLGTSSWKRIPSLPFCDLSEKKICAYGDMHWLIDLSIQGRDNAQGLGIISFDFKKEEFYWTPHPTLISMVDVPFLHLLTLRGSIAIAYASSDKTIMIWVLKNYDTKEWELKYSISSFRACFVPEPGLWPKLLNSHTCGEWEYGIFFMDKLGEESFFLDLRPALLILKALRKILTFGCSSKPVKIVSYARSFMSLKDYGQLVKFQTIAHKDRMRPRFLQIFGQCFVNAKKIGKRKHRLWAASWQL